MRGGLVLWEYNYNQSDELFHYGVKGMRWGVRKSRPTSGGTKKSKKKSLFSKMSDKKKKAAKAKEKSKEETQEPEKKKSVKDMSDAELRVKISRLQLEKQYADLSRQTEPVSKGKKFVEGIMTKSGENIGTQLTTYVMGTAVNKALAGVFKDEAIVNPKKGQKDK